VLISYEQQKFSLFREESEGYAKLCLELLELKEKNLDKYELSLQNITSLIGSLAVTPGFFGIDVNRVIDLVLEFSVHSTSTDLYIKLLAGFKKEFIPQILGFKFQKMASIKDIPIRVEATDRPQKKNQINSVALSSPVSES